MVDAADVADQLDENQLELLARIVERVLDLPRTEQRPFILALTQVGDTLIAPDNTNLGVLHSDLETLADAGLLRRGYGARGAANYTPTPLGRQVYQLVKDRMGDRLANTEDEVRRYLSGADVPSAYRPAMEKWRRAEQMLWNPDNHSPTEVGHVAREALQAFAGALVDRIQPAGGADLPPDPQKTVARIRACLDAIRPELGDKEAAWLRALLAYWGTVSDLAQRQEHGAGKEGEALRWEDSRRLVFHTAIVMYELVRLDARSTRR